jgi:integrase
VVGADLTLAEARKLAAEIDHERAGGTDVIVARKVAKLAAQRKAIDDADNSYPVLLQRYIEEHARPHTKRWRDTARMLGLRYQDGEVLIIPNGLVERWSKPVREITADDIFIVVDGAVRVGAPGLKRWRAPHARAEPFGRMLHSALSGFFGWCVKERRVDANPCAAVHKPRASTPRERVLSDEELVAVWHGCEKLSPPFAAMVKLLILTGGRLRECARLRWSELREDGVWVLPASRAKNKREHRIPLTPLARDIIRNVPRVDGSDFVLTCTGRNPVDGHGVIKKALDEASGVTDWVWHDLRRTVATGLQRLGVRLEVTEAVLNHTGSRAGIVGIYQRYAFDDEKRAALAAWADRVAMLTGGNIVDLAGQETA